MAYSIRRIDDNQNKIVDSLRRMGMSVAVTSSLSNGFPDLIIGFRGQNYMIELKDGSKIPSKQKLTIDEEKFHSKWLGQIDTCKNIEEILVVLGI